MANPLLGTQTTSLAGLLSSESLPVSGRTPGNNSPNTAQTAAVNDIASFTSSDAVEISPAGLRASQGAVSQQPFESINRVNSTGESSDANNGRAGVEDADPRGEGVERVTFNVSDEGRVSAQRVSGTPGQAGEVQVQTPTPGSVGTGANAPDASQTASIRVGESIDLTA